MSKDHINAPTSHKPAATPSSTSKRAESELRSLDAKLRHLSDKVIQQTPYILTVPTDRPYHLDRRLQDQWKRGTPFDSNEEQLQYLSFLPEWDNGLITPVGAWNDEKGGMDTPSQSGRSSTLTPKVGGTKVKLSLSDYKKKAAGQAVTPKPARENEEASKQNGAKEEAVAVKARPQGETAPPLSQGHKRPREDSLTTDKSKQPPSKEGPSTKKLRPSSPPSPQQPKRSESANPPFELPPPLSPTLPPVIEAELARRKKLAEQESVNKDKQRSKNEEPSEATRAKKVAGREKSASVSRPNGTPKIHVPQVVQRPEPARASTSAASMLSLTGRASEKLQIKKTTETKVVAAKPAETHNTDTRTIKAGPRSKIVKLKIPKSIRKRYEALVRMQPQHRRESGKAPKKEPAPARVEQRTTTAGKTVARSSLGPADAQSRAEKRPRQDAESDGAPAPPPSKRPRAPSNLDLGSKPSTPVPPSFKSPVISQHGSAQKPKASTPAVPAEEAATPHAGNDKATPTTSDGVERPSKDNHGRNANVNNGKARHPQYNLLHSMQADSYELGRHLKRKFSAELAAAEKMGSNAQRRLAIALGLESALSFMLSYSCRDERDRTRNDDTWITLIPFLKQISDQAKNHAHVKALCLQIEAVCYSVATGQCAYSKDPEVMERGLKYMRAAHELFIESASGLSVDDLQHNFPNTWRHKSKEPLAKKGTKFEVKVDGAYYLPLSSTTTGLEAVRAGKALLVEWCKMEGVEWTSSLGRKLEKEKEK
jgi:hypothetical protein